jgi:hypothetical protein
MENDRGCTLATMEDIRSAYKLLGGISEGKRALRRFRCSCEDNIKMYKSKKDMNFYAAFNWLRIISSGGLL